MAEVLGRLIRDGKREGVWRGVRVARGIDPISHLQFADDTLLMGESSFQEARVMRETLDLYRRASEQCVNWRKSEVFLFNTLIQK